MTTIEKANKDTLYEVAKLAKAYETDYTEFVTVDVEYSYRTYLEFIEKGHGCAFVLKINDQVVGGISGLKFPDINSGIMTAVECFWFVKEEHRGAGLQLLAFFESWAKEQGCKRMALIHLVDSFPDVLEKVYLRRGYRLVEKHYVKEVL